MNQFVCAFMIVFFVMASQISPNLSEKEQVADTVFKAKHTEAYVSNDKSNTFVSFQPTAQRISLPEENMKQLKKPPLNPTSK